jgi:hypothetical protein
MDQISRRVEKLHPSTFLKDDGFVHRNLLRESFEHERVLLATWHVNGLWSLAQIKHALHEFLNSIRGSEPMILVLIVLNQGPNMLRLHHLQIP